MLLGKFSNDIKLPYIDSYISLPNLHIKSTIQFCIDTGSDSSAILPDDSIRLKINFSTLSQSKKSFGLGGDIKNYIEKSRIAFKGLENELYIYETEIQITEIKEELRGFPSLLGRNILNKWDIIYKPKTNILVIDVLECDKITNFNPSN